MNRNTKTRFLWSVAVFTVLMLYNVIVNAVDVSRWSGYDDSVTQVFDRGVIVEFADDNDFCHSYVLIPGLPLASKGILLFAYFFCLIYLFLGIAIVADIFMGSIEVITSQSRTVSYEDDDGIQRSANVSVWNPTIANLTLMALGSSAPEILLACIETIADLGNTPGELGPATIVGSAAFNLLVISAVCVISVPTGTVKKIEDTLVFAVTAITSLLAYVWLYIVLEVWSEGEIEIAEAVLTFLFFPIFIIVAYIADKIMERKRKGEEKNKLLKQRTLPVRDFYHIVGANDVNKASKVHNKGSAENGNKLKDFFHNRFGTTESLQESLEKMKKSLEPTDPIQQRIFYRRMVGKFIRRRERTEIKKDEIIYNQIKTAEKENKDLLNPIVGFRCLHYSVSEGIGKIKVKVINKVGKEMEIGVRTEDDTANAGSDYVEIDEILKMPEGQVETSFDCQIINDDKFEPDEDFYIELYDPETGKRLERSDTRTKVTIIDDDKPGKVGFTSRFLQVRGKDKVAKLKILRQQGTDGQIQVNFETVEIEDSPAKAYAGEDFVHVKGTVTFEQGENEKDIIIPVLEREALEERGDQFEVKLSNPTGGAELGKKSQVTVEIIGDTELVRRAKGLEDIIKMIQKDQHLSWLEQFKQACILSPQVDESGVIDEIDGWEAALHFCSIGWKVLFALIPPARYWKGWPTFVLSLAFIGAVTAIVGEFAALFGCVIGLKQSLAAISVVALGTSLPDTFASRQAALQAPTADVAIGNITGSNCVNVFLGLGFPWLIGSIYYASEPGVFLVPKEGLSFGVLMFLITSSLCLITLVIRRFKVGGELGGMTDKWKWITGAWFGFLWLIYPIFSGLNAYGVI